MTSLGAPRRFLYAESAATDPYFNLALEKCLFDSAADGTVIFYLWQNEKTVVCGRNQNVCGECRLRALEAIGGRAARRLSGGGAVFHDLGNLNFTFITRHTGEYAAAASDLGDAVIARALRELGISAAKTGRNDLAAPDGRKFSGSAFLKRADGVVCRHGTLMVDVDTAVLEAVLDVDREKLRSKGVASVRSRVVNLAALCPGLTVSALKSALKAAFCAEYAISGELPTLLAAADGTIAADAAWQRDTQALSRDLAAARAEFADERWIFGKNADFTHVISRRFDWGGLTVNLRVEHAVITHARLDSDALEADFLSALEQLLPGTPYRCSALEAQADRAAAACAPAAEICADVKRLLRDAL